LGFDRGEGRHRKGLHDQKLEVGEAMKEYEKDDDSLRDRS